MKGRGKGKGKGKIRMAARGGGGGGGGSVGGGGMRTLPVRRKGENIACIRLSNHPSTYPSQHLNRSQHPYNHVNFPTSSPLTSSTL